MTDIPVERRHTIRIINTELQVAVPNQLEGRGHEQRTRSLSLP